jgi:hypothetical protein
VFVHRFRDTDAELRILCMERLGDWLLQLPSYWLDDKRLKYLGWTLNDKVSSAIQQQAAAHEARLFPCKPCDLFDVLACNLFDVLGGSFSFSLLFCSSVLFLCA